MPKLKAHKEVVFRVDHNDLDSFIREAYGLECQSGEGGGYSGEYSFEYVASEELSNDVSKSYYVSPEEPNEYDRKKIEEMKQGKFAQFITCTLLCDLCHRGLIEPGKYIIDVSW
jgi:hypothetical protein